MLENIKEHKPLIVASIGAVVVLILFLRKKSNPVQKAVETVEESPFLSPFYNQPLLSNGGGKFNSVINVNINPNTAQYLNRSYIPLFGFVGMNA